MVALITSNSYKLIDKQINSLINDAKNITTINYKQTTLTDILNEASYYSLFAEEKTLIIKNANFFGSDKLNEKDEKLLLEYLENPNPATFLIFVTYEKVDMRKKITKYINSNYKLIDLNITKNNEVITTAIDYVKNAKYQINYDCMQYIAQLNNYNYDLIIQELDKIFIYFKEPTKLDISKIQNLVAPIFNDNQFKFVDAVLLKDLDQALKLFQDLNKLKVEPTHLIHLLAREYRLTYMTSYLNKTINEFAIAQKLKLQQWQVSKYLKQAANYNLEELLAKIKNLATLDYKIKSGKIDKILGLKSFILENAK